jgi:hypothetical protein
MDKWAVALEVESIRVCEDSPCWLVTAEVQTACATATQQRRGDNHADCRLIVGFINSYKGLQNAQHIQYIVFK